MPCRNQPIHAATSRSLAGRWAVGRPIASQPSHTPPTSTSKAAPAASVALSTGSRLAGRPEPPPLTVTV